MQINEIQIGKTYILKGFERNRPVRVTGFIPYDFVRDGKHFKYSVVEVRMPEGDLNHVSEDDLRDPV